MDPSNPPEETLDRLDTLLSCYFEDELDAESLEELSKTLATDPEARQRYMDLAQMHIDLTEHFRSSPSVQSMPITPLNLPTAFDGPSVESL